VGVLLFFAAINSKDRPIKAKLKMEYFFIIMDFCVCRKNNDEKIGLL
jgi:hypothetical protein